MMSMTLTITYVNLRFLISPTRVVQPQEVIEISSVGSYMQHSWCWEGTSVSTAFLPAHQPNSLQPHKPHVELNYKLRSIL